MSAYVDSLLPCVTNKNWKYNHCCHLVADSLAELHAFAACLGLKREWFQNKTMPHYDLTRNKRKLAVELNAIEIDRKQFVELLKKQRL